MTTSRERELESALATLPRVQLASVRRTPLEHLPRLSEELGGPPVYIKRDDLTGLAFGGLEAIASTEGLLLDPAYTSKAMAGLFDHVRGGRLDAKRPVVFLHTGGTPALFGYASDVLEAL